MLYFRHLAALAVCLALFAPRGVFGQAPTESGTSAEELAPSEADERSNWWFGARAGVMVFDLDPLPRSSEPRRLVRASLAAGASVAWVHGSHSPGWQAGIEFGLWLKQFRNPEHYLELSWFVGNSIPILARLQYDFGHFVLRYQMGISTALPIPYFVSRPDLFSGMVGGGAELHLGETRYSVDFVFQGSRIPSEMDDGYESYISQYLVLSGVSW